MQHTEYRIEEMKLTGGRPDADQIVEHLNKFGADGWRVSAIDLANHPSWASRSAVVLLERVLATTSVDGRQPVGVAGT